MSIISIPGGFWIPPGIVSAAAIPDVPAMTVMNTAAIFQAYVVQVPKSGTLDQFEIRQAANSNTPDNGLHFSFQDVDANGVPDNTVDQFALVTAGFGAGTWLVPANVMTDTGAGGGVKRVVSRGDWIACVIRINNFVAGDSIALSYLQESGGAAGDFDPQLHYPLTSSNSGTAWTKVTTGPPILALKYNDGSYGGLGWPVLPITGSINSRSFNDTLTPDERGLVFQVPFPARLTGCWLRIDTDNPVSIVVYDAANAVLTSVAMTAGRRISTGATNARVYFPTAIDLAPNVNYRVTILPTSSASVVIYDFDTATAAIRESIDGGATWMSTQRTDAGSWTNVTTNRPFMGLIFDGFDDATGGGGGESSHVF